MNGIDVTIVLPTGIDGAMLKSRTISRSTVLAFGLALVLIAGVDELMQTLATAAKAATSKADDAVFVSKLSTALYLLPAMFGGIGINIASHVLLRHLSEAERRFERERHHE